MDAISVGSLRLNGGFGIRQLQKVVIKEYPGQHSQARLMGMAGLSESGQWGFEGMIWNQPLELWEEEGNTLVYSGIVREVMAREENGVHFVDLQLSSGSILIDLEKENASYQDMGETYGEVLGQVLSRNGAMAIYPDNWDTIRLTHPMIQYQETAWEFIRRLASRFGYSLYSESTMGGAKLYIGIPDRGEGEALSIFSYTAHLDRKFYEMGGEAAGNNRGDYLVYEVKSYENRKIGERVEFQGKPLYITARTCSSQGGHLEFVYTLSGAEWAGAKRISNGKFSGMSLLGTVLECSSETVKLKLDIDQNQAVERAYPWKWTPATGNVMYMMPQTGSRVSLYFKGEEEESAQAVTCIRSSGSGMGADYRDRTLTTEAGKQMRLCRNDMGFTSSGQNILLDDRSGIQISGSQKMSIIAAGKVTIKGEQVSLTGASGVVAYEGLAQADGEGTVTIQEKAKINLSQTADLRGGEKTYYAAWVHENLSGPENRYRDEPEYKDYPWGELAFKVTVGAVVTVGVSYGGGALAGGAVKAAQGAGKLMGVSASVVTKAVTTGGMTTGMLWVGGQALGDMTSGRVGSMQDYVRKALAGSVVGMISGASALATHGLGLPGVMAVGFGEGAVGSGAVQLIMTGEIDWKQVIKDGGFSSIANAVVYGVIRGDLGSGRVTDKGPGNVKNPEAHNVVNYAKLKEQYRVAELGNDIVDNLNSTGQLPSNYITKSQAKALGWSEGKALSNYAPGKALGGDIFDNTTGILPTANGRVWYEADVGINYNMSRSNPKNPAYRILYSNDGLIFGTYDHYDSVFQIYP